jgi:hypothetical protein
MNGQLNKQILIPAFFTGLELNMDLPSAADNTIGTTVQSSTTEQDELSQRLARLRQV